jgi:hypothetical protein
MPKPPKPPKPTPEYTQYPLPNNPDITVIRPKTPAELRMEKIDEAARNSGLDLERKKYEVMQGAKKPKSIQRAPGFQIIPPKPAPGQVYRKNSRTTEA